MKTTAISTILLALLLISCEKEGAAPEIDFHELGMENSKTVFAGEELHMDAEILAENKVERIELEIHSEGDYHDKGTSYGKPLDEWEFDTVYTKFSGVKNPHFHEHIEIPGDAEPGDYHFHFVVTDMEGYQATFEEEIEVLVPAGSR